MNLRKVTTMTLALSAVLLSSCGKADQYSCGKAFGKTYRLDSVLYSFQKLDGSDSQFVPASEYSGEAKAKMDEANAALDGLEISFVLEDKPKYKYNKGSTDLKELYFVEVPEIITGSSSKNKIKYTLPSFDINNGYLYFSENCEEFTTTENNAFKVGEVKYSALYSYKVVK